MNPLEAIFRHRDAARGERALRRFSWGLAALIAWMCSPAPAARAGFCGSETAGSCFETHGPFCDDEACCGSVCAFDAFCCDAAWDQLCAEEAWSVCAPPASFNIDFGSAFGAPAPTYGAAAGMPGIWQQIPSVGVDAIVLNDRSGNATLVTITFASGNADFSFNNPGTFGNDQALLDDALDLGPPGSIDVITISHLPAGEYRVTTYAWAPDSASFITTVAVDFADQGPQAVGGAWPGALQAGVTHAVHTVTVDDPGGELTITTTAGPGSATLNAIQIEPLLPTFNIDFGSAFGSPPVSYGAAGGDLGFWDELSSISGRGDSVVDTSGSSFVFLAPGNMDGYPGAAFDNMLTGGADQPLMDDFLNLGFSASITVQDLPNVRYKVYSYAWNPQDAAVIAIVQAGNAPEGNLTCGGAWPGTLAPGITHTVHTPQVQIHQMDLSISTKFPGTTARLTGLQLVPVIPGGHVAGCPAPSDGLWSCFDNWDLPGPVFPDNVTFQGTFDVLLDNGDDVVLDVPVVINSLTVSQSAVLHVNLDGPPGPGAASDLAVEQDILIESDLLVAGDNVITADGVTVAAGGFYGPDPDVEGANSASLDAARVTVNEGPAGAPGSAHLEGAMSVVTDESFTLVGTDDNCTPPILRTQDAATAFVGGDFVILGSAEIQYASSLPLQLAGAFRNTGRSAEIFDWPGSVVMGALGAGTGVAQTFEVAGRDLGATQAGFQDNYAMGGLEILSGSSVTFVDNSDNDGLGQGPCEALYVGSLTLGAGATVTLTDARIYYHDLNDFGATIPPPTGCGALIRAPVSAADLEFCADQNGDGIRDSNCMWWTVSGSNCSGTPVVFADLGGFKGACPPDGVADLNDRFHVLNCFSDLSVLGVPPYPCEENPPSALNVDAGSLFGGCAPDGVCDGNDVFHVQAAFSDFTLCSCPADGGPAPTTTTPPEHVGEAGLTLLASSLDVRGGDLVEIEVRLSSDIADLRGYQLHLSAGSGRSGRLELTDIVVQETRDQVFAGRQPWRAFNVATGQMVAGLEEEGIPARAGAYLATFVYRVSSDAEGDFVIELRHGQPFAVNRSFLFATRMTQVIDILPVTAVQIRAEPEAEKKGSARREPTPYRRGI
jgi:hypothetical protein